MFDQNQKRLEDAIYSLNLKVKEINGDTIVPRLAVDMVYLLKKKNKPLQKLRNYSLLRDGVHANTFIAKLWSNSNNKMCCGKTLTEERNLTE